MSDDNSARHVHRWRYSAVALLGMLTVAAIVLLAGQDQLKSDDGQGANGVEVDGGEVIADADVSATASETTSTASETTSTANETTSTASETTSTANEATSTASETTSTASEATAGPVASSDSSTTTESTEPEPTGPASTTTTFPSQTGQRRSAGNALGISPGGWFADESDSALAEDLDKMVEAGVTWIRLDFDWSEIERTRDDRHWHRTDRAVDAASQRGIKVLGLISQSPGWARRTGLGAHAPPLDPQHYAAFSAAAVERYQNRGVEAWELWNEPNLSLFWQPKPDPEAYAQLVVPTVAAMRAVDSDVFIISGGLAPAADESNGSGISPSTFVTRMFDAGADIFDGYGIHPYSYPARPIDSSTAAWNPFNNLPRFRSLLQSKGQTGKPIWLTEYGAPTGTSSRAVSEAEQAAQITEAIAAVDGWSWTGPLFLYSHRDFRNAPADFQSNFGMMRSNGSPKQAWRDLLSDRK